MSSIDLKNWTQLAHSIPATTWKFVQTEHRGRAICALRKIHVNELLFEESPLLLGPIGSDSRSVLYCVACRQMLAISQRATCSRGCGLPLCGSHCQQIKSHDLECERIRSWQPRYDGAEVNRKVLAILSAIRGVLLNEKEMLLLGQLQANRVASLENSVSVMREEFHEINSKVKDFLERTVSVFNTNAFHVSVGSSKGTINLKGLYALAAQLNHNCVPNTRHTFDETNYRIRIHATRDISAGEEITTSYTSLLWDTSTRRIHLYQTKQFWCDCTRCADRTELVTYLAALKCRERTDASQLCPGRVLPIDPLNVLSDWECDKCTSSLKFGQVRQMQQIVNGVLKTLVKNTEDVELIWSSPSEHRILRSLVWPFNKSIIEAKLQILWSASFGFSTRNVLMETEEFCKEILELINLLGAGECTLKQLIIEKLNEIRVIHGWEN